MVFSLKTIGTALTVNMMYLGPPHGRNGFGTQQWGRTSVQYLQNGIWICGAMTLRMISMSWK
ncbi:unnamed protein product [Oikopleura dioica]|uniref:Uncharacterized protein n=1 Tax=Oikopleura dioica TaxID=34765 RepID=E4WWH0_OIKDI|nr:unnamed protein product [Oikopleura dioica]CBY33565.1 unnamed protein product [Oikopleura dioica]